MQNVDARGLDVLDERLKAVLKKAPEMRRKLHESLAHDILNNVYAAIGESTERHTGNLAKWQKKYVGSKGGYAAVRATDESSGKNSPGAITNYVNSGHRIRRPSGNAKKYKHRINVPYVDGRHFYDTARSMSERTAIMAAEDFCREIAAMLEGK